jgi:hypothetical protein
MMHLLNHGAQYVIYAPYIKRIINFKTEMEFGFDGKHGEYQPHIVKDPTVPPPSPPAAAAGTFAAAPSSPPTSACAPPASEQHLQLLVSLLELPLIGGKKQNILIKGLKTLICMCRSNDALIRESHQQMS